VAIPLLSGPMILMVIMKAKLMQCCLTCLAAVNSLPNDQAKIYSAEMILDLVSVEVVVSYQQHLNHLIVITSATHLQINLVMVSLMKVVSTCSLTRRMETSQ
jgi:hypothetical protein